MKTLYENPWFSVIKTGQYHYIRENGSNNGAATLLIQADKVLLLSIKRAPFETEQLEIPRGYGEPGETPLACAVREVYEETGYRLSPDQLHLLGKVKPNSSILQSEVSLFWADIPHHTVADPLPDTQEGILRIQSFSMDEIRAAITAGEITDGFTLAALGCY